MSFFRNFIGFSSNNESKLEALATIPSAPRKSPQEIYDTLVKLHSDETLKNIKIFRPRRDLEIKRNYILQSAFLRMKDKLNDTDDNYDNCKNAIMQLFRSNINYTTTWLHENTSSFDSSKDLGEVHRVCIALMPEVFIELLWMHQLAPDHRESVIAVYNRLRDELKEDALNYDLPAAIKKWLRSQPLFHALSVDEKGLTQEILGAIYHLDARFAKGELILEPLSDKKILNRLLMLLDNWIAKKEWNTTAYAEIKADSKQIYPPLYNPTLILLNKISAYADLIPIISAIDIKMNRRSNELRP